MPMRLYRVTIPYREPTYGDPERIYQGAMEVYAPTREAAVRLALREFKELAELSSARWEREVVRDGVKAEVAGEELERGLRVATEARGPGVWLMSLMGRLDAQSHPVFTGALSDLAAMGCRCVVLDMTGLAYVNSTGLATLVDANDRMDVRLAAVRPNVLRLLNMIGLEKVLRLYESPEEALRA